MIIHTTKANASDLADTIMLSQFTPGKVRAWMLQHPFFPKDPQWPDYVDLMIATIAGEGALAQAECKHEQDQG